MASNAKKTAPKSERLPGKKKVEEIPRNAPKKAPKMTTQAQKDALVKKLAAQIADTEKRLKQKAKSDHVKPLSKCHSDLVDQRKSLTKEPTTKKRILEATKRVEKNAAKIERATAKLSKQSPMEKPPKRGNVQNVIQKADASKLEVQPIQVEQPPVPSLAYGLERVLFNPGVYQLQDPRSRVYNFDPYLQKIMPVAEFDFNALKDYVTSSKDESLKRIAQEHRKRYTGSTSSMTSMLAHFHFLLSQWRPINTSMLSKDFPVEHKKFTEHQRCPSAIFLRWKEGSYAIDADKQFANANVLSMLGKSMEKLLTLSTDEFEKYRKSNSDQVGEEEEAAPESFHYSTIGDFLMRSQLDAHDSRLPGTGMFDLKTRAVISIRMDVQNYEQGVGYQIKDRQGPYESYEREYYDMIRAAFLKYSMQVRMGRMDGIFVAFHNVERIFGFQYISLNEMDQAIHGQYDTTVGDQEFTLSLDLLNKILDRGTKKYPETVSCPEDILEKHHSRSQSLRLHFETRDAATPFMYIFAEPVTEEQVDEIQSHNDAKIQEFESRILGMTRHKDGSEETAESDASWENIQANVESAMDKDELGLDETKGESEMESQEEVREPSQQELFGEGPLFARRTDQDSNSAPPTDEANEEEDVMEKTDEDESHLPEEQRSETENSQAQDSGECADDTEASKSPLNDNTEDIAEVSSAPSNFKNSKKSPLMVRSMKSALVHNHGNDRKQNEADKPSSPEREASYEDKSDSNEADAPFFEQLQPQEDASHDILAMTLTLRNKVNGAFVLRPEKLSSSDTWSIEYSLVDVPDQARAWALYQACQARRKKKLDAGLPDEDAEKVSYYIQNLRRLSAKGRAWRDELDEEEKGHPVRVLGLAAQ